MLSATFRERPGRVTSDGHPPQINNRIHQQVHIALMDGPISVLEVLSRFVSALQATAEFGGIGR